MTADSADQILVLLKDQARAAAMLATLIDVAELVIKVAPRVRDEMNGAGLPAPATLALAAEKARNCLRDFPTST